MLDHISIRVSDLEKSKVFYEAVLAELGMKIVLGSREEDFFGFGYEEDEPIFEIASSTRDFAVHSNVHIAFKTESEEVITKFHKAALLAGAEDNGFPGPRPEYSNSYFAAFFKDLDGNNIEACTY